MKYRITVEYTQRIIVEGECTNIAIAEERMDELMSGVITEAPGEIASMHSDKPVAKLEVVP